MNASAAASSLLDITWKNRSFPVDPITISEKIGVKVMETELPPSVSGALIKEHGKDPVIAIHHFDSNNRKRFSCAHELGHYISRIQSNDEDKDYQYIDLRSGASSSGTDEEEIFANKFAASLLMPESKVKELFSKKTSRIEMAILFGVSNEALKYRLKNLGIA